MVSVKIHKGRNWHCMVLRFQHISFHYQYRILKALPFFIYQYINANDSLTSVSFISVALSGICVFNFTHKSVRNCRNMSCQINKRIQETRAKCDDYRKDLTHCDHTSTICVHVYHRVCVGGGGVRGRSGGVVQLESAWMTKERIWWYSDETVKKGKKSKQKKKKKKNRAMELDVIWGNYVTRWSWMRTNEGLW